MENINKIIGKNLTFLRKRAKLTQLEFANTLNYSDKAISKWEKGESMPSIEILFQLAKFYNLTLNDLVTPIDENAKISQIIPSVNKLIISLLAVSFVWLVATVLFVSENIMHNRMFWQAFVWAVPASCAVGIIFNSLWGIKRNNYVLSSILCWTFLASVYLHFITYNLFIIFILGIPIQILIFLWSNLKKPPKSIINNPLLANKDYLSSKQNDDAEESIIS